MNTCGRRPMTATNLSQNNKTQQICHKSVQLLSCLLLIRYDIVECAMPMTCGPFYKGQPSLPAVRSH
eukprot:5438613-Pleurochrysis_carterae.AAC.1